MAAVHSLLKPLSIAWRNWKHARVMAVLLTFRLLNLALAYLLIIIISKLFLPNEYVLFEKITFFLMLGNIFLAPVLISMWHGKVEHLIVEGFLFLIGLSILASLFLLMFTNTIVFTLAASAMVYFFCYYLKATLYTHLITGKRYYSAYGCNTLFYVVYICGLAMFAIGAHLDSYLLSFLLFPSLLLILIFLLQWRSLLGNSWVPSGGAKSFRDFYSIALLAHNVMVLFLVSGERLILESYAHVDVEILAAFLYLTTIVSAFQSLGISLAEWLRPQIFERLGSNRRMGDLYKIALTMLLMMFIVFLAAGWPVLSTISTEKVSYFAFYPYFLLLTLTQLVLVVSFFIDLQIVYRKKYIMLLMASSAGLLAKVVGYVFFNGLHDLEGVVFANLLGASTFLVFTSFFVYYLRKN